MGSVTLWNLRFVSGGQLGTSKKIWTSCIQDSARALLLAPDCRTARRLCDEPMVSDCVTTKYTWRLDCCCIRCCGNKCCAVCPYVNLQNPWVCIRRPRSSPRAWNTEGAMRASKKCNCWLTCTPRVRNQERLLVLHAAHLSLPTYELESGSI